MRGNSRRPQSKRLVHYLQGGNSNCRQRGNLIVANQLRQDIKALQERMVSQKDTLSIFSDTSIPEFVHSFTLKKHLVRIATQQGAFTVCSRIPRDHGHLLLDAHADLLDAYLRKFIIPQSCKLDYLINLMRMNITASSLFPGLEGLGRSVKELVRLEVRDLGGPLFDRLPMS